MDTSTPQPARWLFALSLVMVMVGGALLVVSPMLAWISSTDGSVAINGFNMSLTGGDALSSDTSLPSDDGTVAAPPLPSLSQIPPFSGGSDSSAHGGIFALVAGAIVLFMVMWTIWGEIERRRSLARTMVVLSILALVGLIHDLVEIRQMTTPGSELVLDYGVVLGIAGAVLSTIGCVMLYFVLGRTRAP